MRPYQDYGESADSCNNTEIKDFFNNEDTANKQSDIMFEWLKYQATWGWSRWEYSSQKQDKSSENGEVEISPLKKRKMMNNCW